MRRLSIALTAMVALAPVIASAQNTVQGRVSWNGVGSSFGWYWRNSSNQVINVMGGAAYSAKLQYNAAPPPGNVWPAGTIAPTPFGPAVDIFCVDFLHTAKTSAPYDAYFTKLSISGPLTNTRSNDLTRYLKAAWLAGSMKNYGTTTTADRRIRANIHAAIWYTMSGQPTSVYDGTGSTTWNSGNYESASMNAWITAANANYGTVNAAEWTVITDKCVTTAGHNAMSGGTGFTVSDNCSQEFLVHNVVPEPATMILLGTGLLVTLLVGGVFRRPDA